MLGVVGVRLSPTRSLTELSEELLLVDVFSDTILFSLVERDGLVSNNFARETLKMESVGMFGVES